jgi:hypothetical protein
MPYICLYIALCDSEALPMPNHTEDFQGWQFVKVSVRMVDQEPRLDNSFASGRTDVEVVGGRGQTACTALYCFDCIQYVQ